MNDYSDDDLWDSPTDFDFKPSKECTHDWVDYMGFNIERFKFCQKCDKKWQE